MRKGRGTSMVVISGRSGEASVMPNDTRAGAAEGHPRNAKKPVSDRVEAQDQKT